MYLKQSTAAVISFGPFVAPGDGVTLVTSLVSALDHASTGVMLSKNGGALTIRHATVTASSYDSYGNYLVTLDTTDTNTLGRLRAQFAAAGTNLPVWADFVVLPASVYDGIVAGGTTIPAATLASTTNITAGTIATVTNLTNLPSIPANWLTAAGTATDFGTEITNAIAAVFGAGPYTSEAGPIDVNLDGLIMAQGTIGSTGNDTTHVHLTGLTYGDDEINNNLLVIEDVSTGEQHARWITDWADTGDLATVATLPFTPQDATDTYWLLSMRQDVTGGSGLDAAGVRSAIGMASANLDTQLSGIQSDTNDIQTRIPAALVSGKIDASVGAMASGVLTATAIASDAITAAKVADGTIDAATFAAGAINAAAIASDAITAAKVADGTIDAATFASGAITATAIASDAITAAKVAADVTTEIQSGLATAAALSALSVHLTGLVVAQGIIGATGNDTTHVHLTGLTYGDDEINNCLIVIFDVSASEYHARWIEDWADTGDLATVATLPFTPENSTDTYWVLPIRQDVTGGSGLDAAGVRAAVGLASANLDTQLGGIQSDTDNIQTRIPAALVSGRIDASVGAMASGTLTATAIASDAITTAKIADAAITDAKIAVPTEVTGVPSTILTMIRAIVNSILSKNDWDKNTGTLTRYKSNGSTVATTQTVTTNDDNDTVGVAS